MFLLSPTTAEVNEHIDPAFIMTSLPAGLGRQWILTHAAVSKDFVDLNGTEKNMEVNKKNDPVTPWPERKSILCENHKVLSDISPPCL